MPADDLRRFLDDSGYSSWMRLRILGAILPVGQAVLRLLLAYAPLPNAVTEDASTGVIPGRDAADVFLASQEYHVSACNIWFN